VRGKNGGVKISPDWDEITVYDVISVIDGKSLLLNRCLREPQACQRSGFCSLHFKLLEAQPEFETLFKKIKL
jgi:DNA-binding IscR family transcriptional regulator